MKSARNIMLFALMGIISQWVFAPGRVQAVCTGAFLDPMNDVCWECIFPIKIGGETIVEGNSMNGEAPSSADASVCVCPIPVAPYVRFGITASLWEPARMIETVKDPYCFPAIGGGAGGANTSGFLRGTHSHIQGKGGEAQDASVFAQAHWWIMPFWSVMEALIDYECLEVAGVDIGYITEVDPFWQDDTMTAIFQPE